MNNPVVHTNVNQALAQAKEALKNSIPNEIFWKEFVNTIELAEVQNNQIFLKTKNLFAKHVLTNEYADIIATTLNKILQANFTINFVCGEDVIPAQEVAATPIIQSAPKNTNNYTLLNPNYLFSNFIVGEFNKTAYNAAQSLFKKVYWNPIFISAGVGLGKTHLLHAIGNEFLKRNSSKSVKYVASDEFVREVYNALSSGNNNIETLKDKYQNVDLLLIDDIQFLAKKR